MIDYLLIVKHLTHEDTINFANLEEKSYYSGTDVYRYSLKGCTDIEVMFYASSYTLKVKGSFLYFQYGHNFVTERSRFIAAVRSVEDVLGIQLGDSFVEEFEYGAFLQVPSKPSDYIRNHKPLPCAKLEENQRPRDKGNFKWYDDQCVSLKMYDAKVNFNKKLTKEVKEELRLDGWNPEANYLKFEAHYKKPHLLLNKGRGITLQDLMSPQWERRLKMDLLAQYRRLYALDKVYTSDRTTAGILMCSFINSGISLGIAPEETRKTIYEALRGPFTPEFSPSDIKARQRQFRKLLKSISQIPRSPYDVTDVLKNTLGYQ